MTGALDPAALVRWCGEHGVPVRVLRPGVPTPTVPEAAAAVGVATERVLKSLVLMVDGTPRLVIAAGKDRLVYPRLAEAFGTSRRRVRMATPDEALDVTGYAVGGMPPFGHRTRLPTWVDAARVRPGLVVVAGGGARDVLLEMTTDDLIRVTGARSAPLTDARSPLDPSQSDPSHGDPGQDDLGRAPADATSERSST